MLELSSEDCPLVFLTVPVLGSVRKLLAAAVASLMKNRTRNWVARYREEEPPLGNRYSPADTGTTR